MNQLPKPFVLPQVVVLSGIFAGSAMLALLSPTLQQSAHGITLDDSPKALVDEAWQIVNQGYVDSNFNQVDWQKIRQSLLSREYTSQEEAYAAIREALEKLNDPYTRFMDPRQFQVLTSQTSGEVSGIGIRLERPESTKVLTVVEPIDNSPAMKAGVQKGDQILAIDGKPTQDMSVEAASNLIRGKVGTNVKLTLLRPGQAQMELTLTRARIELPTVYQAVRQEGGYRIGYIRLSEFSAHAADQMRRAIRDLLAQKVDAFVLDLRGNPGGLLNASIEISRMWLDKGAIVRTVDRQGKNIRETATNSALTDLPLAILVDGYSASSSEILTGALQDNKRAVVIGTQTFGKALVQSVHSLSDGSGLAVTIAHYYTPNGTDISRKGITPDVQVALTDDQKRQLAANPALVGTISDPQYARAINTLEATALNKPFRTGGMPARISEALRP